MWLRMRFSLLGLAAGLPCVAWILADAQPAPPPEIRFLMASGFRAGRMRHWRQPQLFRDRNAVSCLLATCHS